VDFMLETCRKDLLARPLEERTKRLDWWEDMTIVESSKQFI